MLSLFCIFFISFVLTVVISMTLEHDVPLLQAVMLAEFDIDAGASFRFVYPNNQLEVPTLHSSQDSPACLLPSCSVNDASVRDSLANLMLPDGAEKREVSATIFLLNRGASSSVLSSLHRFPAYTFLEQPSNVNRWVPLRAQSVRLPEILQIDEQKSRISIEYHDNTFCGPWLVSQVRLEFPEETPFPVAIFISTLQEGLRCKENSSSASVSGAGSGGGSREYDGLVSGDNREFDSFIFLKLAGDFSSVGIIIRKNDLSKFLQVYDKIEQVEKTKLPSEDTVNLQTHSKDKDSNETDIESKSELSPQRRLSEDGPLFGVAAVVSLKDSTAPRGGITKAVAAVGSSLVWLQSIFPLLSHCAYCCCRTKGTNSEGEEAQRLLLMECYNSLNPLSKDVKKKYSNSNGAIESLKTEVQALSTSASTFSTYQQCRMHSITAFSCVFSLVVPLSPHLDNVVLPDYHLEHLLLSFGAYFIQLILGILTGKKIIVLSREHSSFEVCQVVIALGTIGSLLDSNFFHAKVFPYVSINETNFSEVPGYIIGSMNPIFENAKVWGWDLLCDLDTEVVRSSASSDVAAFSTSSSFASSNARKNTSSFTAATVASNTMANIASAVGIVGSMGGGTHNTDGGQEKVTLPDHAALLYKQLMSSISHMQAIRLPLSERCFRLKLQIEEYCHAIALMGVCEGHSHFPLPTDILTPYFFTTSARYLITQSHLAGVTSQVRSTVFMQNNEPPHLLLWCAALRRCGGYALKDDPLKVQHILDTLFNFLRTDEDVLFFLRRMPVALGGLNPVAMQLVHSELEVRKSAMRLLRRVESSSVGRASLSSLTHVLLLLYDSFSRGSIL